MDLFNVHKRKRQSLIYSLKRFRRNSYCIDGYMGQAQSMPIDTEVVITREPTYFYRKPELEYSRHHVPNFTRKL